MIPVEKAEKIALESVKNRKLLVRSNLTDSWMFSFYYPDGTPAYDSSIRVYKEDGRSEQWNPLRHPDEYRAKYIDSFHY